MKTAYRAFVGWYCYYRGYALGCGRIESFLKSFYWFKVYLKRDFQSGIKKLRS